MTRIAWSRKLRTTRCRVWSSSSFPSFQSVTFTRSGVALNFSQAKRRIHRGASSNATPQSCVNWRQAGMARSDSVTVFFGRCIFQYNVLPPQKACGFESLPDAVAAPRSPQCSGSVACRPNPPYIFRRPQLIREAQWLIDRLAPPWLCATLK